MKRTILNLGCGKTRLPESTGVDFAPIENYVDVVHNLNKLPYPFKKQSVDEIHCYHVLEHLDNTVKVMEEFYRILRPHGKLFLRVPHFSSMGAFSDITHVRPFGFTSFDCFQKETYHHFYTTVTFNITKKKIKYFGLYPNSGLYAKYIHPNQCFFLFRPIVRIVDFLISLSPVIFERFWCYWVGGATEIIVEMEKV